jgi:CDP-glucose 4,6-dehydratase
VLTGHTGFKGSWLAAWLQRLGAEVVGIALDPPSRPAHFDVAGLGRNMADHRIDIRQVSEVEAVLTAARPHYVFHLAARALVRDSYEDPVATWQTNLFGTLSVLEALRKLDQPCAAVLITSDKCYDNVEWVWGYRENDALGGPDPYSGSKGAAELAIRSHVKSFFPKGGSNVRIVSARAGNVIGGGDWAQHRIVPDCVRAWSDGRAVELRNPRSTRPWQHVLEALSGYLTLACALTERADLHGEAFNFGPAAQQDHTVLELVQQMARHWANVRWNVAESEGPYESEVLKLNCDKALHLLRWRAVLGFEETARLTAEWYRTYYERPDDIAATTHAQLAGYVEAAKQQGLEWAQ